MRGTAARVRRPSTRELRTRMKGLLSGNLDQRIEALKLVLMWYDDAQSYMIAKPQYQIGSVEMKALSRATKCRKLGISEVHPEAKETGFKQAVTFMEKFCKVAFTDLPSVERMYKEFQKNRKMLEAAEQATMDKYERLIDALNAMARGRIKFKVSKVTGKPRSLPNPEATNGDLAITYSRKQAKILLRLMRAGGVLDLFAQEMHYIGRSLALKSNQQGGFYVDFKELAQVQEDLLLGFVEYARTELAPKTLVRDRKPSAPSQGSARKGRKSKGRVSSSGNPDRVGGRYMPGSAIATIFELLMDGKEHDMKEINALSLGGVNVASRLKRLTVHGIENGRWDVSISGSKVQMDLKKP